MGRALQALIDSKALLHNYNVVKEIAPNSKVMAMVKADAYGHGLLAVARILKQADALGVACIEEAILLRRNGIENRIALMQGFYSANELDAINEFNLEVVVHNQFQLESLLQKNKKPVKIWLKINTGMNRLGFSLDTAKSAYEKLISCKKVSLVGIITHLASADETSSQLTKNQIERSDSFCVKINTTCEKSIANSAGILGWNDAITDWVRPGLMLYGVSPFANKTGLELGLKPVMQLETEIIAIHNIKKGEGIGYNHKFIADKGMTIGIIAIGYADGIGANFTKNTKLLIKNKHSNFIGKVSMDMAAIDLTNIAAKVGDKARLWGDSLPLESISQQTQTSCYELLTKLGARVSKVVV